MASTSERTYGSKVANASKIAALLKTFPNYIAPAPDISIASYDNLVSGIVSLNSDIAVKKANYSSAVEARQQLFFKANNSIAKSLSPVIATIKATLGKNAKPVTDVSALIVKIRGAQKAKPKDPNPQDPNSPQTSTVSQSTRSYGSIMQAFSDIIDTVASLDNNYVPANEAYQVSALKTTLTNALATNDNATIAYATLKTGIDNRLETYNDLSQKTQRIKEAIKAQYGVASTQYKLIKGLSV